MFIDQSYETFTAHLFWLNDIFPDLRSVYLLSVSANVHV